MSLNSKKSWHPGKAINRAKVSKLEETKNESQRQADERRREIVEEKELARLKKEAKGEKQDETEPSQLEWIYNTKSKPDPPESMADQESKLGTAEEPHSHRPLPKAEARKAAADPLAAILERSKKYKPRPSPQNRNRVSKSDHRSMGK